MTWFFIALAGYVFLAAVMILDKLIVAKSAVKPVIYTFYSTIFMIGALFLFPIVGFGWLHGVDWIWAIVSGLGFGFGLWAFYQALRYGEVSHLGPFNGAIVTVFLYTLGWFFLSEKLSSVQIAGIVVLVLASFLLSFEKSRKHSGWHVGFVWAILSGLCFAISHVGAKYLYEFYPFWTGFVWSRAMTALLGIGLLVFPSVRHSFSRRNNEPKTYAKKHATAIIVANKLLGVFSIVLIQYAMFLGSVTIVGAMAGLQYPLMFVFIYLLTRFLPKVFKEYFTKREITVEVIAILLVVIGSIFFVL